VEAGAYWLAAALALGLAELAVPGVFLVFLAIGAAITGVLALALPELPTAAQLGAFAAWSTAAVLIGRRWYVDYPVASEDALLNDRGARLVGRQVVVAAAITGGCGRVRLGDGEWPARGPDAAVGTAMRVAGVEGATLLVEPAVERPSALP
jgi:inner membrane protein